MRIPNVFFFLVSLSPSASFFSPIFNRGASLFSGSAAIATARVIDGCLIAASIRIHIANVTDLTGEPERHIRARSMPDIRNFLMSIRFAMNNGG